MIAELQSRYFAKLLSRKVSLPKELRSLILEDDKKETAYFYVEPDMKSLVVLHDYIHWFAEEIGCVPNRSFWIRNPGLWKKYFFTSTSSYFFRLVGPGSMRKEAEAAIGTQEAPMNWLGVVIFSILIFKIRTESLLDRLFSHSITRGIEKKWAMKREVSSFFKEILKGQKAEGDYHVKLCCRDNLQWVNLKYRLSKHYGIDRQKLTDAITFHELENLIAS